MSAQSYNYESLKVTRPAEWVIQVELNRPQKLNAMHATFWREITDCFKKVAVDGDCRVVVLSAAGRIFTAGLDLTNAASMAGDITDEEMARRALKTRQAIKEYQESFNVIEKCTKPVIAAVHNGCVGGGVDMITACDIRYCTQDAWFQIQEVNIGIIADVGTLQRLPKVVGNESFVREMAYSGRRVHSQEALQFGLVSRVFPDREAMINGSIQLASEIASKSPVAVQGSKVNLLYTRDHTVAEGLEFVAAWNMSMLQSQDMRDAIISFIQKTKTSFAKL